MRLTNHRFISVLNDAMICIPCALIVVFDVATKHRMTGRGLPSLMIREHAGEEEPLSLGIRKPPFVLRGVVYNSSALLTTNPAAQDELDR